MEQSLNQLAPRGLQSTKTGVFDMLPQKNVPFSGLPNVAILDPRTLVTFDGEAGVSTAFWWNQATACGSRITQKVKTVNEALKGFRVALRLFERKSGLCETKQVLLTKSDFPAATCTQVFEDYWQEHFHIQELKEKPRPEDSISWVVNFHSLCISSIISVREPQPCLPNNIS